MHQHSVFRERVAGAADPDRHDGHRRHLRQIEGPLLELANAAVVASRPLRKHHDGVARAHEIGSLLERLEALPPVAAVDRNAPQGAHGRAEHRHPKELLFGEHSERLGQGGVEHRDVEVALVVGHHDERLVPAHALAALHFDLDSAKTAELLTPEPGEPSGAPSGRVEQAARDRGLAHRERKGQRERGVERPDHRKEFSMRVGYLNTARGMLQG